MLNVGEIFYNLIKTSSYFSYILILYFLSYYLFFLRDTGGPQIVLFLYHQGTVLLGKPYYSGTDLVLKSRFMTFGFSKLVFKHFWYLKVKNWSFGFILKCLLNYLSKILTSKQDFRQFFTYKSIYCIIFGYTYSDFCNNHQ